MTISTNNENEINPEIDSTLKEDTDLVTEKATLDDDEIKQLTKEKLISEIELNKRNWKWKSTDSFMRIAQVLITVVILGFTLHYTFKTDNRIEKQTNILAEKKRDFQEEIQDILVQKRKNEFDKLDIKSLQAKFDVSLMNEKKDSISQVNSLLTSDNNHLQKKNNTLNVAIAKKAQEIEFSYIDVAMINLASQNIHLKTFDDLRAILKRNDSHSKYLIKQLKSNLSTSDDLLRLECLYVLSFSENADYYKQLFLNSFIDVSEGLNIESTYFLKEQVLFGFISTENHWSKTDAEHTSKGVINFLKANLDEKISSKSFFLQCIMELCRVTNFNVGIENPKLYIEILKENNKLIQKGNFSTIQKLSYFSPQLWISQYFSFYNQFCFGGYDTRTVQFASDQFRMDSTTFNKYEVYNNEFAYAFSSLDIQLDEAITLSGDFLKKLCEQVSIKYSVDIEKIEVWTNNEKLDFFIKNKDVLKSKLINGRL